MPGASLIDFLNRIAMTNPPCRFATICDLGQDCGNQPLLASHGEKGPTAQVQENHSAMRLLISSTVPIKSLPSRCRSNPNFVANRCLLRALWPIQWKGLERRHQFRAHLLRALYRVIRCGNIPGEVKDDDLVGGAVLVVLEEADFRELPILAQ